MVLVDDCRGSLGTAYMAAVVERRSQGGFMMLILPGRQREVNLAWKENESLKSRGSCSMSMLDLLDRFYLLLESFLPAEHLRICAIENNTRKPDNGSGFPIKISQTRGRPVVSLLVCAMRVTTPLDGEVDNLMMSSRQSPLIWDWVHRYLFGKLNQIVQKIELERMLADVHVITTAST